jgi:ubiquinone/menaquinone biosynthesis C-methylase UbiE
MDPKTRQHYELEKRLAQRILDCAPEARPAVYLDAYDTLFREISWHPSLRLTEAEKDRLVEQKLRLFAPMVGAGRDVLEIGCGRGDMIGRLAARNRRCVGVDVSKVALAQRRTEAPNLTLLVMEACHLEFPDASFDVVLSSQVVEHLHPDDVTLHLREVHRVLRPRGRYIFDTPNRLVGPHDVSKFFDETATGFHLKEWSYGDLLPVLKSLGFGRVRSQFLPEAVYSRGSLLFRIGFLPAAAKAFLERAVAAGRTRPERLRRARWARIAGVNLSAEKLH